MAKGSEMTSREIGRVLVAGAGIGGLALAQALRGTGIDVEVFEVDAGSRAQGYRIGLRPEGWDALRGCLPERLYALAEATSGDLTGPGLMFDERLTVLSEDLAGPATDSRAVDREVFRDILLGGLGERVRFGKRLADFAADDDGVRAFFADGTHAAGDVLVGADGGNSATRRRLLPDIGLERTGLGGAMGRTPLTDRFRRLVPGRGTMIKGPNATLMLGRMEFTRPPAEAAAELAPDVPLPGRGSYVRWVLMVPPGHPAGDRQGGDGVGVALEILDGWHPEVRALISATEMSYGVGFASVLDRPVTPWTSSRVTLLGDAAHLTLASGGNGATTALEDARRLAAALTAVAHGDRPLAPALTAYRTEMLTRGESAVQAGKQALNRFVPSSP